MMKFAGDNLIMVILSKNAAGRSRQSLTVSGFERIHGQNRGKTDDTRTV
jgi:hypothetical protein